MLQISTARAVWLGIWLGIFQQMYCLHEAGFRPSWHDQLDSCTHMRSVWGCGAAS